VEEEADAPRQRSRQSLANNSRARKEAAALRSAAPCDLTALAPHRLFPRSMRTTNRLLESSKNKRQGERNSAYFIGQPQEDTSLFMRVLL